MKEDIDRFLNYLEVERGFLKIRVRRIVMICINWLASLRRRQLNVVLCRHGLILVDRRC